MIPQVIFQAYRSFSILGDIAIDDISFSGCGVPGKVKGQCQGSMSRVDLTSSFHKIQDLAFKKHSASVKTSGL